MTQTQWTVNEIKAAMRASGSHWFDPSSMRFFGTKILPTVYQGPGGVFFVTSEQPPHGKRAYSVRQYSPDDNEISTIGEICSMGRDTAIRAARKAALGAPALGFSRMVGEEEGGVPYALRGLKETTEAYRPITTLDQFVHDLTSGTPPRTEATESQAKKLVSMAKRHHHYMELLCSDEAFCRGIDEDGEHPEVESLRRKITALAEDIGAGVKFSGDPRGCTVKLTFTDGYTNDFAKEGYCIPIE